MDTLNSAATLARLFKAQINILHVLEHKFSSFTIFSDMPDLGTSDGDKMNSIDLQLQELAAEIAKEYQVEATVYSAKGNVCNEVVQLAKELKVDLIVMGKHGTSGWQELLGSNAYKVVGRAHCPVLTIPHKKK